MSEKFTPGGWRAEIIDHSFCDTGDYITEFGVVSEKGNIAQCFDSGRINEDEAEANTYLIAAAPEMYWMLEQLHGALQSVPVLQKEIEKVLKKARGGE